VDLHARAAGVGKHGLDALALEALHEDVAALARRAGKAVDPAGGALILLLVVVVVVAALEER
jgi:hypothetical protein